jgi:hypothetical protein
MALLLDASLGLVSQCWWGDRTFVWPVRCTYVSIVTINVISR